MKQPTDTKTMELPMPGAKRGRGRPATGVAMTSAERQKAYRDRLRSGVIKKSNNERDNSSTLHDQFADLQTDLAAAKMRIKELATSLVAMQSNRDDAIKTIEALRKEHALLVDERCKAFKVAEDARAELEKMTRSTSSAGKLASEVLKLEQEKRELLEDKTTLAQQGSSLITKVRELEAALKKRNASRKNKTATESN